MYVYGVHCGKWYFFPRLGEARKQAQALASSCAVSYSTQEVFTIAVYKYKVNKLNAKTLIGLLTGDSYGWYQWREKVYEAAGVGIN